MPITKATLDDKTERSTWMEYERQKRLVREICRGDSKYYDKLMLVVRQQLKV